MSQAPNKFTTYRRAFTLILVLVSLAFFWILKPYFGAIFWGIIISILFVPLNNYILRILPNRRNIAALLTVLFCLLVVVIPLIFLTIAVAHESEMIYEQLQADATSFDITLKKLIGSLPSWMTNLLGLNTSSGVEQKLSNALLIAGEYITGHLFALGQNLLDFVISFFLMLYLMFFLLRDGNLLLAAIRKRIPLADSHKRLLINKFIRVIRATIKGNVIVALFQSVVTGVLFWFLDLPAPLLCAVGVAIFAMLPIGSGIVLYPIAMYYQFTGSLPLGIFLAVATTILIIVSDSWLRPLLVGKDTQMPDYLVMISTFGGMLIFGINGFVIGPMIAALFLTVWDLHFALTHHGMLPRSSIPSTKPKEEEEE